MSKYITADEYEKYDKFIKDEPCELLILKSDILLHQDDKKKWAEIIEREREKGLIILPPYFTPLLIPNDVEIRIEQEPCGDAISREAAIDIFGDVHPLDHNTNAYIEKIKALPSVTPSRQVIEDIKAEIDSYCSDNRDRNDGLYIAMRIIDKHIKESAE